MDLPDRLAAAGFSHCRGYLMEPGSDHWQSRFKCEQILEVGCPKCSARPHEWCDRDGDRLSRQGRALLKAGTPPSHQERMWTRQGHAEHEFPGLLAKQRPGCWDGPMKRTGKPLVRARGGCTPCATERKVRENLKSPLFPVDFPCRHPGAGPVPPLPARYTADRVCPECARLVPVKVVVQDPRTIGYRCGQGHMWLAGSGSRGASVARSPRLLSER